MDSYDANQISRLIRIHSAKTGKELLSYVDECSAIPLNIVFATTNGDIGYSSIVPFPIRKYNLH